MAALFGLGLVATCGAQSAPVVQTRNLPFAITTLTLYDHATDENFAACFDRIETVLQKFDMHDESSEISAVNRAAGHGPVTVSDEFRDALRQGLRLSEATEGMFDTTVGPLVKLWRIGSDEERVPKPEEIQTVLRLVGWKDVVLDDRAKTVTLPRAGMTLDFGAVLKGFSAVETGRLLAARGVRSAVVDIGGSVMVLGAKPDGSPWRVGVQKPDGPRGTSVGIVEVRDSVVNTSGSYEQFFVQNGRRYQHIFDPHTGYPVDNGVESATVIANRLTNGDGPSLSVLALGVEKGLALARKLGIDVIIITTDRKLYMTPGARSRFTLTDSTYSIAAP